MITVVVVCGILRENLTRGFRNIYINFNDALQGKEYISHIPVLYWTREENSRLNKIKDETMVVIKGHLESDDEYGVYIMCESIHFTK